MSVGASRGCVPGPSVGRHLEAVERDEPDAGEQVGEQEEEADREREREQVAQMHQGGPRR